MKLYKYSLIAALALSGALCACSDDDAYAPAEPVSGNEVYFPISESASIDIPDMATSVAVTVDRVVDTDAINVSVTSSVTTEDGEAVSGIFTVPSQVSFAAGEKSTKLDIAVDFAKVEPDVNYVVSLKLEGDNTTPYGASERVYTLVYSPWSEWELVPGEVAVYDWSVGPFIDSYEVPVVVSQSKVNPSNYRYGICNLYYGSDDGLTVNFTYSFNTEKTIDVDGVKCPIVTMSVFETETQISVNGGAYVGNATFMDSYTWSAMQVGEDNAEAFMERNGIKQSYYNPETGTFAIYSVYTIMELPKGSYLSMAYDYLQLPGYKSYSVDFEYTGNYVNPVEEVEYAVVSAVKSEDVDNYIYDIFAGELDENGIATAIEDLKAAEEPNKVSEAVTNLTFALEEDGLYTIVAIGRDSDGNEVCKSSYTFEYATVQGAPKWTSLGMCEYTDGILCAPNAYNLPAYTFDVEIQESTEYPGYYRLVDPYAELAAAYGKTFSYLSGKHYLEFDASNPERVDLCESWLGIADAKGEYGAMGKAFYQQYGKGVSADVLAQNGFYGSLKDGVITFPAGMLYLIQGNKLYTCNMDPENPTLEDENPDLYWGKGTFCIDMNGVANASASAKKAPVKKGEFATKLNFKSEFTYKKKEQKKVTNEDIHEYRLANPKTMKF